MNKIISRAVLIIEIIVALIFGAVLIDTCSIYRDANPSLSSIITVASLISAIIFPLAAHIVIRVKHRSNTPEGELLPFLFLSITFECFSFLPIYYIESGNLLLDPIMINVLIRFAFLTNALVFLFVSLLLIGVTTSNYISYFIISMVSALILSIMAPSSSSIQAAGSNFGSDYDVYFNFAIALITIVTIITLVGFAMKDKMRHSIEKSITYILFVIGNYGIFSKTSMIVTAISTVILIISSIMLMITSKESF